MTPLKNFGEIADNLSPSGEADFPNPNRTRRFLIPGIILAILHRGRFFTLTMDNSLHRLD